MADVRIGVKIKFDICPEYSKVGVNGSVYESCAIVDILDFSGSALFELLCYPFLQQRNLSKFRKHIVIGRHDAVRIYHVASLYAACMAELHVSVAFETFAYKVVRGDCGYCLIPVFDLNCRESDFYHSAVCIRAVRYNPVSFVERVVFCQLNTSYDTQYVVFEYKHKNRRERSESSKHGCRRSVEQDSEHYDDSDNP